MKLRYVLSIHVLDDDDDREFMPPIPTGTIASRALSAIVTPDNCLSRIEAAARFALDRAGLSDWDRLMTDVRRAV